MTRSSKLLPIAAVSYGGLALSRVRSWRMLPLPRAVNHSCGTGGFIDRTFYGVNLRRTHRYTFHRDSCTGETAQNMTMRNQAPRLQACPSIRKRGEILEIVCCRRKVPTAMGKSPSRGTWGREIFGAWSKRRSKWYNSVDAKPKTGAHP